MNIQTLNQSLVSLVSANPWIIVLLIWSTVWKLIALWKAAKNNHMTMFIIIAILNTVGVLEIAYLLYLHFRTKKGNAPEQIK